MEKYITYVKSQTQETVGKQEAVRKQKQNLWSINLTASLCLKV